MKTPRSFHPYALVTVTFWSLANVLTRLALQYFTPVSLGFLRYTTASLALLILCVATRMPLPKREDLKWFAAAGAAGFGLYTVVFNTGAGYVTAATSAVVLASAPVLTAILASFVFRERLGSRQWVAIGVEFVGILILTVYGGAFSANRGILWLLLASLLVSSYNLMQRTLTKRYPALQSTTYSIFFGTLLLAVFGPRAVAEVRTVPPVAVVYVLVMGVFCSAVAYVAWSKAFERAEKTSMVSNYMFFTPFITGVLGFVLAREVPEATTWVGGAMILLGALLFNRGGQGRLFRRER